MGVKKDIEDTIQDLIGSFLYYDRKECVGLPVGRIEQAVRDGEITVDEIVKEFEKHLLSGLK